MATKIPDHIIPTTHHIDVGATEGALSAKFVPFGYGAGVQPLVVSIAPTGASNPPEPQSAPHTCCMGLALRQARYKATLTYATSDLANMYNRKRF